MGQNAARSNKHFASAMVLTFIICVKNQAKAELSQLRLCLASCSMFGLARLILLIF